MLDNSRNECRPISLGLIGLGRQGRRHLLSATQLARDQALRIDALVDIDPQCSILAKQSNIPFYASVDAMPATIDACVIATPTQTHLAVASAVLERRIDVLLEKPVAATLAQTRALVRLAEQNDCIFQVGYLERYHSAFTLNRPDFSLPTQIFSNRSTTGRSIQTLSELVLELMIHDLDMLAAWLNREPIEMRWSRLRCKPDKVGGRLDLLFTDGHRAQLFAESGVGRAVRQTVVNSAIHSWNFSWAHGGAAHPQSPAYTDQNQSGQTIDDPLSRQLRAFVQAVRTRTRPMIDGESALKAMRLAERAILALPVAA